MATSGGGEQRRGWGEYYSQHADRAPRAELVGALDEFVAEGRELSEVVALDIGAGPMVESRALLDAGVGHVIATDSSALSEEIAANVERDVNDFGADVERFSFHRLKNEELAQYLEPASLDMVVSYFALPFTRPDDFSQLWHGLRRSLKPGGILSVTLFGDQDGWAQARLPDDSPRYPGMTFHTRAEVDALCADMESVKIDELEYDGTTNEGQAKHWHVYKVQARQPQHRATPDIQV